MLSRDTYDNDAYWRKKYLEFCHDLADELDKKDDEITSLKTELKKERRKRAQLEAELWNVKKRRKR